ncbi:hypothetical protein J2S16_004358 [Cytobacillus kochii]|nr:hypothetical protein [Cytobacillus kochii]
MESSSNQLAHQVWAGFFVSNKVILDNSYFTVLI